MKTRILLLMLLLTRMTMVNAQNETLRENIRHIVDGKNARVGVAIRLAETGDTLCFFPGHHFPMQSVYKFHLSLAIYNLISSQVLSVDQPVHISSSDLLPETWSPLREKYPEGNVDIPLREIIRYTVSESDNNGCDILFRLAGGPAAIEKFIKDAGISDISIRATEEEMHKDWHAQFTNWTTPVAAVTLLDRFYRKEIISDPWYGELWKDMLDTSTGIKRIRGLLPPGTAVAHKTGSSGTNDQGITAAVNDIGIIMLPGGKHLEMAIFVTDSKESNETNERIIAEIALAAYNWFTR